MIGVIYLGNNPETQERLRTSQVHSWSIGAVCDQLQGSGKHVLASCSKRAFHYVL